MAQQMGGMGGMVMPPGSMGMGMGGVPGSMPAMHGRSSNPYTAEAAAAAAVAAAAAAAVPAARKTSPMKMKQSRKQQQPSVNIYKSVYKAKKATHGKQRKNPKRPLTAYTCFLSEVRPGLMADHPDKTFQVVAAMVGKLWKELDDVGREPYKRRAQADMERFHREKAEQAEKGPEVSVFD